MVNFRCFFDILNLLDISLFGSFSADLINYQALGRIIQHQGMIGYLMTGPQREPIYPLICAGAMDLEKISGISFTHLMAGFGILMLITSQILLYVILKKLNIRTWICAVTILYWGLSPAVTNSAFNVLLFCEIVTYPFVLAILLFGWSGWEAIQQNNLKKALGMGILSGITFAVLTFIKAAFECICPAYFLIFLMTGLCKRKVTFSLVCFLAAAGILFYIPVLSYKSLNKAYNGNFCIADRGPLNLYGNAERRVEPLTLKKYFADLASVAGVCENYFKPQACSFWAYTESDGLGDQKTSELTAWHLPPQAVTDTLLRLSKEKVLENLPQYILLTVTEGLRMFFWEASVPFFPLNFIVAALTFFAFIYCCFDCRRLPVIMLQVLAINTLFVFFYSFFAILPRHMLPIVPLYLISISYCLSKILYKGTSD